MKPGAALQVVRRETMRADLQLAAPGRSGQIDNTPPAAVGRRTQKTNFCGGLKFTASTSESEARFVKSKGHLLAGPFAAQEAGMSLGA